MNFQLWKLKTLQKAESDPKKSRKSEPEKSEDTDFDRLIKLRLRWNPEISAFSRKHLQKTINAEKVYEEGDIRKIIKFIFLICFAENFFRYFCMSKNFILQFQEKNFRFKERLKWLFFISHRVNRGAAYAVFTTEEDALDGHIKCLEIKPKPIKWVS